MDVSLQPLKKEHNYYILSKLRNEETELLLHGAGDVVFKPCFCIV